MRKFWANKSQGAYKGAEVEGTMRSAGKRWHQGIITSLRKTADGKLWCRKLIYKLWIDDKLIISLWIHYKLNIYHNFRQVLYDGHHTKDASDGKWVGFKDYSANFTNYEISRFRLPPNSFAILESTAAEDDSNDEYDVYLSYATVDCPSAHFNRELPDDFDLPPSYESATLQNWCDPREIRNRLEGLGYENSLQGECA